ncbi:cell filamentation protein Fic [Planctomycetota bacterium]|nr:cell filamentation protein Fic [Planctomycetota bacterium]
MTQPPPFTVPPVLIALVAVIGEQVGRLELSLPPERQLLLRRTNRLRTIQGSLAIEGNTLTLEQVTAVVAGKRVLGSVREVQEVRGAVAAYDRLGEWDPTKREDLLAAHGVLMTGLVDRPGHFRTTPAGIQRGDQLVHVAPPAGQVRALMNDLFAWLKATADHPLIAACVFHYEFEFIHPFVDGNGRMGRLWQTLILSRWKPLFALVPVESLIRDQQAGYYSALNKSNQAGASTPFIAFMLQVIHDALTALDTTPQVAPQVTPQVARLLAALTSDLDRAAIQKALGLADRKSFSQRYLQPALEAGLVELTLPDKPNSRLQQYRLTARGRNVSERG